VSVLPNKNVPTLPADVCNILFDRTLTTHINSGCVMNASIDEAI
jgi:hypothetical protein